MLTHTIISNNSPLLTSCVYSGVVPNSNGVTNSNTSNSIANTSNMNIGVNSTNNSNSSQIIASNVNQLNLSSNISTLNPTNLPPAVLNELIQQQYQVQQIQDAMKRYKLEDLINLGIINPSILPQLKFTHPQYNYTHLHNIESSIPSSTPISSSAQGFASSSSSSSSSCSSSSSTSNITSKKLAHRSPSLSPENSPVNETERLKDSLYDEPETDEKPFPRMSSIDNINKRFAKINPSTEYEHAKLNDTNLIIDTKKRVSPNIAITKSTSPNNVTFNRSCSNSNSSNSTDEIKSNNHTRSPPHINSASSTTTTTANVKLNDPSININLINFINARNNNNNVINNSSSIKASTMASGNTKENISLTAKLINKINNNINHNSDNINYSSSNLNNEKILSTSNSNNNINNSNSNTKQDTTINADSCNNSPSSSNNQIYVPPCTSNGINSELKKKLRLKILSKLQEKSPQGSHHNSNSNSNSSINNISKNNIINNYLQSYSMYDDSGLRRVNSEPNFKVKSALKDRIRKRNNPLLDTNHGTNTTNNSTDINRPLVQQGLKQISSGKLNGHNSSNNEEIPISALAAAPSLKFNKDSNELNNSAALTAAIMQQQGPLNQQLLFNPAFNTALLPFLNRAATQSQPYLNPWQALAAAAALDPNVISSSHAAPHNNHHHHHHHQHHKEHHGAPIASLSSLPNLHQLQERQRAMAAAAVASNTTSATSTSVVPTATSAVSSSRTSFIPQFGSIAHVDEEAEMMLANELRDASKLDEEMRNEFMYGDDDDDEEEEEEDDDEDEVDLDVRPRGFHSYNAAIHRHPRHFSKKISCFSDPYLMRTNMLSQQIHGGSTIASNESLSSLSPRNSVHRLNRRGTISAETAMEFATADERPLKYTTGIVYDSRMLKHECTCHDVRNHIETPARLQAIWNRFQTKGVVEECEVIKAKIASIEDIAICHSERYATIYGADIETRPKLSQECLQRYIMDICLAPCNGFALVSDQDNSWNEEHTPIACRVAIGSTYELSELVYNGKLKNGFALVRPPGSHAEYNKPLGFCYFNNVAIAAKLLKKNLKLERILIVDWDVHHGNGTQNLTYDDPNILYISLHRHDGGEFFPGSGAITECGTDEGLGYNVNIAWNGKLDPAMGDAEYLAAFRTVVMPIAKEFKPQIVLVSCGFDGTASHPKALGGYKLTSMCFAYMTKKLMSLAEGKVVLVLEGGYDLQSLCDCSEMCVNALLNKQIPSFSNETLDAIPNNPAIETLEQVIEVQKKHWPVLKDNAKYIKMSQNQFLSTNVTIQT